MIRSLSPIYPIEIEEVTLSPAELAAERERWQRYERNRAWLKTHAHEIYPGTRGKFICIAAQELFVADSGQEALALAQAAHPEDDGRYLHYIPRQDIRVPRIYANQWRVARMR
jgi:hypothetical protein